MQTNEYLKQLLLKHIRGTISESEREQLFLSLDSGDREEDWKALINELSTEVELNTTYNNQEWEPVIKQILEKQPVEQDNHQLPKAIATLHRVHFLRNTWFRYAAAAIIIFGTAAYFWPQAKKVDLAAKTVNKHIGNDVAPGGNKAVLTLANGSQIILDSAANGILTQQGNTKVIKLDNGQLAYNLVNKKPGELLYNTISTPRGGEYQVVLADGSKVWLNATSSIKFPTSFSGNKRDIELTGEGYFEIAHDATKPFVVKIKTNSGDGGEVEVLGTHFNINAYDDEKIIKTTLLEGAVKVSKDAVSQLIKPGQQAQLSNAAVGKGEITIQGNVDVEMVMAWKNGHFAFKDADIHTVMRQLARWYNVEVSFEGELPKEHFSGEIGRGLTLDQVLKGLAQTRVRYRIEGGSRIIILPQ